MGVTLKNFGKIWLAAAISVWTLAGCTQTPVETGPSALDLATQKVCVKMSNSVFRTDVYFMFSEENLATWTQDLDPETSAEFLGIIQPIVDGQTDVAIQESASTFFGKAKVVSFPALEALQIRCSTLGLPVTLPERFSQYVD